MFGTWPAQDAKDWEVVRFGLERIKNVNSTLKTINYSLGWIQPLAFVSYKAYGEAAEVYIGSSPSSKYWLTGKYISIFTFFCLLISA